MSETEPNFTTGEASVQETHGYEPLPDRPKERDLTTSEYSSDEAGLREAALDWQASKAGEGEETRDRFYQDPDRSPTPENRTVKLERSAKDLQDVRAIETQAEEEALKAQLGPAVDKMRADLADLTQQKPEQKPEAQPQAQPEAPQTQHHEGLDPAVAKAISDPRVAAAIQNEIAEKTHAAEAAKELYSTSAKQFADTTKELALLSVGQTLALVAPEVGKLPPSQWGTALAIIQQTDPGRAEKIHNALATGKHLFEVSKQYEAQAKAEQARVQQQYAQQQEQATKAWIAEEERKFEAEAKKNPERVATTQKHLVEVFQNDYGVSPGELAELAKMPWMKSHAAAKVLMDAVSYRLAQRSLASNPVRNVPPTQRPGVARGFSGGDDANIRGLEERFSKTPTDVRLAAKLLQARRNARG